MKLCLSCFAPFHVYPPVFTTSELLQQPTGVPNRMTCTSKNIQLSFITCTISSASYHVLHYHHRLICVLMEEHASLREVRGRARDTYFVTLKMRSNRRARNTLIPKDVPGFMVAHTTSKILPTITCTHTQFNTVRMLSSISSY